ncbi:hypothetical protein PF007_g32262 [Phytophthora fragariae]|uniref:Jacalin-type lectin domain-containing protein n=1 Tax=Phytophthora fragariae TaxID=53985 RepID=A0A6A3PPP2_9STRA|nr:hypothetical protein PF003_g31934 [Phytophthora fragariae]KAE8917013.1 hypothetical protein PF009_g32666 [Phytophthora fragariae]KAE9055609.1 hypothetical protein PF007_g32262 [Phytophthora fragariae]KAE9056498.1 hypothetical protein PF006_g32662 [Phytophthora fragariae]
MKFLLQALTMAAIIATGTAELPDGVILGETFGGPHGNKYSDVKIVKPAQVVKSVTIRAGERVNGVGLGVVGLNEPLYHGGRGGDSNTLTFSKDEYVVRMEAHWDEQHSHTRVFFINFTTNANNSIYGGTPMADPVLIGKATAPPGYQLGGFDGYAAKELDSVAAIWTSIKPVE